MFGPAVDEEGAAAAAPVLARLAPFPKPASECCPPPPLLPRAPAVDEEGKMVAAPVRVGTAVDTVAQVRGPARQMRVHVHVVHG